MMTDEMLKWKINNKRELLHTPVFDVMNLSETSAAGYSSDYVALEAPDWAMVIPEHQGRFLLVRQWRHAAGRLFTEFPGGVVDAGESPEEAALRELREETGCTAGELIPLGTVSPNPALFCNRFHVFLARDLKKAGDLQPDDDELLSCGSAPIDEVIAAYGTGDYGHALMGTALALYLIRERRA